MSDCHEFETLLDAYVDDELDETARHRVEGHLEVCATCRQAWRGTVEVVEAAASLRREVAPSRDLWPGIAARIGSGSVVPLRRGRVRWLAAAATLAAAAALILAILPRQHAPVPVAVRPAVVPAVQPAVSAVEPMVTGEDELDRAADELHRALEARRDLLSPETRQVIDDNLAIIDVAIANVRRALAEDPNNQALAVLLTATYQRKIDVLRIATDASRRI